MKSGRIGKIYNLFCKTSCLYRLTEKNLRKKWRNIRDYFMKELKLQGTGKSTTRYGRKRNRYSYYNHLLFLMPSMKPKQL